MIVRSAAILIQIYPMIILEDTLNRMFPPYVTAGGYYF